MTSERTPGPVEVLLGDKEKWTTKCFAKNIDGDVVSSDSPDAIQWCVLGGIFKCYSRGGASNAIERLYGTTTHPISYANDILGYDFIMDRIREANI